jgi:branched-chain amino acid transport system substrate-binding protein
VEKEVEDMGGILGGRPLQVVKYDDRTVVADAVAGVTKLVLEDNVSVVAFGGSTDAEGNAIADAAAQYKVLFVTNLPIDTTQNKYVIAATVPTGSIVGDTAKLVTDVLKPKTVAMLGRDEDYDINVTFPGWKKAVEAAGANVVYAELTPIGVLDFTPYLTKIKYYDPDVLILEQGSEECVSIAKQMMDLGGWGHTQVVAQATALSAVRMAGTKGWLVNVLWYPGLNTPASVKFEDDFKAVNGKLPEIDHVFYYFALWSAIHAIELAGTAEDREAIAQAARSGNLEYDSPVGHVHYTPDGDSNVHGTFVQMQGNGTFVPFNQ